MTYAIHLQQEPSVRYRFIDEHRGLFSITAMCRVLQVSPSGYYAWRRPGKSRHYRDGQQLLVEIKAVHARSKQRYGSPRIYRALRAQDVRCSENRVARLMRLHEIRAKQARRFKATTDSDHMLPAAENVLDRQFAVDVPDARLEIFAFIEVWYNRERLHSSLGYLSPAAYEEQKITRALSIAA